MKMVALQLMNSPDPIVGWRYILQDFFTVIAYFPSSPLQFLLHQSDVEKKNFKNKSYNIWICLYFVTAYLPCHVQNEMPL